MDGRDASSCEPADADDDVDAEAVARAVEQHAARATVGVDDMRAYLASIVAGQPDRTVRGPVKDGAGSSGVCVHRGRRIAAWGDPTAVEMSFSVTKTYLSLLAGVAVDEGLIGDVNEPVAATVAHDAFSSGRHARITWRHLLQQTSDWWGTLWGVSVRPPPGSGTAIPTR